MHGSNFVQATFNSWCAHRSIGYSMAFSPRRLRAISLSIECFCEIDLPINSICWPLVPECSGCHSGLCSKGRPVSNEDRK